MVRGNGTKEKGVLEDITMIRFITLERVWKPTVKAKRRKLPF